MRLLWTRTSAVVLVIAGFFLSGNCYGQESGVSLVKPEHAWFKPYLTVNADPACSEIQQATLEAFMAENARWPFAYWDHRDRQPFAGMRLADIDTSELTHIIQTRDATLHMGRVVWHGCGGACETYQYWFSDREIPETLLYDRQAATEQLVKTPGAAEWNFFTDSESNYFLMGVVVGEGDGDPSTDGLRQSSLHVYRLVAPEDWKLSCAVRLTPDSFYKNAEPELKAAHEAVNAFSAAVQGLMRDAGDCGTLRTHGRWMSNVRHRSLQTLFQPWQMKDSEHDPYGRYDADLLNLDTWALGGLSEYESLLRYRAQFSDTAVKLARFYEAQFQMQPGDAAALVRRALEATASAGIRFYEYEAFPEAGHRELRRAVLERRPLDGIKAISVDVAALETSSEESILSAAVLYPEALQYLLERGANPNRVNAFGKTPLMYAAQYNALEAVTLLLKYGADPGAQTTEPYDRCYYTLQTTGMTPLHYAARYASPAVIEALIAGGASTFSKAEGLNSGTPLDWLWKYTAPDALERNPNIHAEEVERLSALLRAPAPEELARKARQLIEQGRAAYRKGQHEEAYRSLRTALRIDESNTEARLDFSLIALRAGRLGESLVASSRLLGAAFPAKIRAAAFFNMGLACEANGRRYLAYNGKSFCTRSLLEPFLQSWQIQPSRARANKLNEIFTNGTLPACVIGAESGNALRLHFTVYTEGPNGERIPARIYVHHRASETFSPTEVHWTAQRHEPGSSLAKTVDVVPRLVAKHTLGEYALLVLDADSFPNDPVKVRGEICKWR